MKDSKSAPWIAGTAIIAIAILAFAWFIVVGPQRDAAAADRVQASDQESRNDVLRMGNAKLAADFANLGDFKAQLAEAQAEIPASIDQAVFSRELDALAGQAGVFITNISFSSSVALADGAVAAAPAAKAPATKTPGEAGSSAAVAAAPPAAPAGMYAIPISVTTVGSPDNVRKFIKSLQADGRRLYLLTTIGLTVQEENGATAGAPATKAGDLEAVVTGYTYTIDPAAAALAAAAAAAKAAAAAPADSK